ncbi:MAG: TetR/AcrR family transcriptional regulator [Janthinobacterium lividum]
MALTLLTKQGRDAVTTRDVAEAAKVQPPVLYRLFGDKDGLLDAVAAFGFRTYIAKKRLPDSKGDPVEGLRAGWDLHVEFGLSNPELYLLMYANPRPGAESTAAQQASGMLDQHMQSVAVAGRLRMSVDRACALLHAAAFGIVMLLLSRAPEERDLSLSAFAREHALRGITTEAPSISDAALPAVANQMRVLLSQRSEGLSMFSDAERSLLSEWLQRLVSLSN